MKKRVMIIAMVVLLPILSIHFFVQTVIGSQDDVDVAPINGTAYWGTAPTGPDMSGVQRTAFRARNPQRAVLEATQTQNQRFLDQANILDNVQVSQSGTFSHATHFVSDFSEVMLAIDPSDPNHFLGSSKFFFDSPNYSFYTGVFESTDGGQNWTQFQPAGLETHDLTSDPVTTFDEKGNGYFTILTVTDGVGPDGVEMLKKPTGGNWGAPVVVYQETGTDKQWIIGDQDPHGISPHAGNVYMCWKSFGTLVSGIVFSRSTDRNQTWSPPIELDTGSNQGCMPAVTPDGAVYVVYINFDAGNLSIVKSTDGGLSFTSPAPVASITNVPYQLPNSVFRTPDSLPSIAASPLNGNLYVAWADYRNGDADIYLSLSTDGGATWSTAERLNDDPLANGIDQFQPQISVAPNGRVSVMWFDRRLDCPNLPWVDPSRVGLSNNCIDTFMTRSYDDGQTWVSNIRASAQTWDWSLNLPLPNPSPTETVGFIGDYQGIASSNDLDFPFWNATANLGDNPNNYQQIFVAHVPAIDLSTSQKQVVPETVVPAGVLSYTIKLNNASMDVATAAMTDTLPVSTTFQSGSLTYSSGSGTYDQGTRKIRWSGSVTNGLPVTISFAVTADSNLQAGDSIINTAEFSDGVGGSYKRTATATVVATEPRYAIYLPIVLHG